MSVYVAINHIMADLAKEGISKDQYNQFQKYRFRGIDDIYNALAPLLAQHELIIMPEVLECDSTPLEKGHRVVVRVHYHLISVQQPDPSKPGHELIVPILGEAADTSDKAVNKAMTAAFKILVWQVFCVPTEAGAPDADSHDPSVKVINPPKKKDPTARQEIVADITRELESLGFGLSALKDQFECNTWSEVFDRGKVPDIRLWIDEKKTEKVFTE